MKKLTRKFGVAVGGGFLTFIGLIMIFTPGPALVFIPAGLALLATEFDWAHKLLVKVKERFPKMKKKETEFYKAGGSKEKKKGSSGKSNKSNLKNTMIKSES